MKLERKPKVVQMKVMGRAKVQLWSNETCMSGHRYSDWLASTLWRPAEWHRWGGYDETGSHCVSTHTQTHRTQQALLGRNEINFPASDYFVRSAVNELSLWKCTFYGERARIDQLMMKQNEISAIDWKQAKRVLALIVIKMRRRGALCQRSG